MVKCRGFAKVGGRTFIGVLIKSSEGVDLIVAAVRH